MEKIAKKILMFGAMLGVIAVTMGVMKIDAHAAEGTALVYVSTADANYHQDGCESLNAQIIPITLNDATTLGFIACTKCKAPALDVAKTTVNATAASTTTVAPTGTTKTTTASVATTQTGDEVWLSATGDKYHKINNCGKMNPNKAVKVTVEEAKAKGKTACKKCFK